MHPNSQKFYHQIATFIVAYAEILLAFQFAFSLPFTQDELPDERPLFLRQLGLEKPRSNAPVFDILLKSLFNLAFWYALKQKLIHQRAPKEGTFEALEKPKIIVEINRKPKGFFASGPINFRGEGIRFLRGTPQTPTD